MNGRRRSLLSVLALTTLAACGIPQEAPAGGQPSPSPRVAPDRPSGMYDLGETVGWTVTPLAPGYTYRIKTNNQVVVGQGSLEPSSVTHAEFKPKEPTMLTLEIVPPQGPHRLYGAAVAPTKLRPVVPKPKDFDAFWKAKLAALHAVPENAVLTPAPSGNPRVDYATIRMDHVNGTHVYGQIARPKKPGKYPAIIQFQWASPPYPLQPAWIVGRADQGYIVLNIEPHDVLPTEGPAYYQGLPAALKSYQAIGQDDREHSYFVEMYLRDVRAVEYVSKLPDWDGKTLIVTGTSMGGQQSLCTAGLCPQVTHLIVNEPAGCDLNAGLHGRQEGYPFFNVNDPKVMETAQYVDPINFASHIKATSLVGMGFVDDVAPPAGIWTAFNLIRGPKEAAPMVDSPHNNFATPEQQRPITSRTEDWFAALAKGEPAPVNRK